MRITQCHISKSVHDFPFREAYGLTEYHSNTEPCVFFGCYDAQDLQIIREHSSIAVIWWCGQDAITFKDWISLDKPNIFHITERKNVKTYMDWCCVTSRLTRITDMGLKGKPIESGSKIFAYCPSSHPKYHGIKIINKLRDKYDILIGDGSINQAEWRAGRCDEYYSQCYMGLVLSPFAGGGGTIIELGLRGLPCITNVMDMPNTVGFNSLEGIDSIINNHNKDFDRIKLSENVKAFIDYEHDFLNISNYTI